MGRQGWSWFYVRAWSCLFEVNQMKEGKLYVVSCKRSVKLYSKANMVEAFWNISNIDILNQGEYFIFLEYYYNFYKILYKNKVGYVLIETIMSNLAE